MAYWIVGAMFGGKNDQYATFLRRGYWYCWNPANPKIPPEVRERFLKIKVEDRIAIKRLLGRGATKIEIRALGIVNDIDQKEWRVYVKWLVTDLKRRVPLHGCAGSIHGPFDYDDEWTREVFSI